MDPIPFLNLSQLYLDHREEYLGAIDRILSRGAFIGGEESLAFEKDFSAFLGSGMKAIGCGNGTDAVFLAAAALECPAGSEAILPAMTFFATAEGLHHAGYKLKLVDITEDTWLMDPAQLELAIGKATSLVVPVHLYGQMAEMDRICEISVRGNCRVLEDAAQAHGALWKKQGIGTFSDIAVFSFYPGKNLGAFGDGGAIASRDPKCLEICSSLKNHGGLKKYHHERVGFNSRLDNLQAAVLRVKLKYLATWNEARRSVAAQYREALRGIPDLILPKEHPSAKHVYHLFVILVSDRDALAEFLKKEGIETGVHYPRAIHQQPALQDWFRGQRFPNAERLAKHGLSLPMCPTLTSAQIQAVARAIRKFYS